MNSETKIDQSQKQNAKTRPNNALNHDRPHLQTPLSRGRLVLHTRLVVCGDKMRS